MIQKISAPVTVSLTFNHTLRKTIPQTVVWEGREHQVQRIGLHHTFRRGRTLYHVFSVASATLFFRLVLNTETLNWSLEEISDGLGD